MTAVCGHEPRSGLYWERLGAPSGRAPFLFIHGGGTTGACFRATPDGRAGWADRLAERGEEVWVTDWPGSGRSGGRDPLELEYRDLIDGYVALLQNVIQRRVVVVCHSMGGAITWAVVERCRSLVDAVIAVAASYPGNIGPTSDVLSDDDTTVRARFAASGVVFEVRRDRLSYYSDAYVHEQGIAGSTRFPLADLDAFRAALTGIAPRVLLQRLGLEGGLPRIESTDAFAGLRVRFVAGPEDPAHTKEIEQATVDLLRGWGADAELIFLADHGIDGNGHFLFLEDNGDAILDLVLHEVRE